MNFQLLLFLPALALGTSSADGGDACDGGRVLRFDEHNYGQKLEISMEEFMDKNFAINSNQTCEWRVETASEDDFVVVEFTEAHLDSYMSGVLAVVADISQKQFEVTDQKAAKFFPVFYPIPRTLDEPIKGSFGVEYKMQVVSKCGPFGIAAVFTLVKQPAAATSSSSVVTVAPGIACNGGAEITLSPGMEYHLRREEMIDPTTGKYGNNVNCKWHIIVPGNRDTISYLTFNGEFDVEAIHDEVAVNRDDSIAYGGGYDNERKPTSSSIERRGSYSITLTSDFSQTGTGFDATLKL